MSGEVSEEAQNLLRSNVFGSSAIAFEYGSLDWNQNCFVIEIYGHGRHFCGLDLGKGAVGGIGSAAGIAGLLLCALAVGGFVRLKLGADAAILFLPVMLFAATSILVEVLSMTGAVSRESLQVTGAVALLVAVLFLRKWLPGVALLKIDLQRLLASAWSLGGVTRPWRWPLMISSVLAVLVLVITLITALITPPNNPDVLAYHLPRAMWWLQEGNVNPYVTPDPQQIAFAPLNNYAQLWVLGVSGTDYLIGLIQWLAFVWSVLVVLLIGRRAGFGKMALMVTGILVVTIPAGITLATTAKAEWLAALWPVIALGAVVSRSSGRIGFTPYLVLLGATAALAAATKATSALVVAVIILLGMLWELRGPDGVAQRTVLVRDGLLRAGSVGLAALVGVLAGFVPQAVRTYSVFQNLTGPDLDIIVRNPSVSVVWGNLVRTVANNIGVPPPISDWVNPYLPTLLPLIGVPIRDDDALYLDVEFQLLIGRNEDFTTNPIHLILGLIAALVVVFMRKSPPQLCYVSGIVLVTFVVLVASLQWNVWTNRFFLAVMVLAALPLGWLLARGLESGGGKVTVVGAASALVVVAAAVYGFVVSVYQEYRPLVGSASILTTSREDQYFYVNDRPGTAGDSQIEVLSQAEALRNLPEGSRIGLIGLDADAYLVWRFLNPDGRYEFVNLESIDGPAEIDPKSLDGIVCRLNCPAD